MNAKIKELWLIVECPHCKRPHVMNKFVDNNTTVIKPIDRICEVCFKHFSVDLHVCESDDVLYGYRK